MKLSFDKFGYLLPYSIVKCDVPTLEAYFVDAFPLSATRQNLWDHYQEYVLSLQREVVPNFIQVKW